MLNPGEIIGFLQDLVRTESPTGKEEAAARLIAFTMQQWGFDQVEIDSHWNVVGKITSGSSARKLLFLNHSDTSARPADEPPPSGDVVNGERFGKVGPVICGRGAAAPKAAVTALLAAGKELVAAESRFRGTVCVAVVTKDLLANHDGVKEIAEDHLKDVTFAVTAEPSDNNIVVASRGIAHAEVEIKGETVHWGIPNPGGNALYRLADFLIELRKLPMHDDNSFGLTGCTPVDATISATPPLQPSAVRLSIDRRLLPGETAEQLMAQLEGIIARLEEITPSFEGSVRVRRQMYPFSAHVGQESDLLKQVVLNVTGRSPALLSVKFATNAAYLTNYLGIPSMVLGPGNIADLGPSEHVEISKVLEATQIYREFAIRYLAGE